jgi:hypothetical protein
MESRLQSSFTNVVQSRDREKMRGFFPFGKLRVRVKTLFLYSNRENAPALRYLGGIWAWNQPMVRRSRSRWCCGSTKWWPSPG